MVNPAGSSAAELMRLPVDRREVWIESCLLIQPFQTSMFEFAGILPHMNKNVLVPVKVESGVSPAIAQLPAAVDEFFSVFT
jgi:hypothetical protein